MSRCQYTKKDGHKCTRLTSTKYGHNQSYCWQHQNKIMKGGAIEDECCKCTGEEYKIPPPIYPVGPKGLSFSKWYDMSRLYWVTIGDLLKIKKGQTVKFLSMHRNVVDDITQLNEENVSYLPTEFFKWDSISWTKQDGLMGQSVGHWIDGDIEEENVPLDLYLNDKCMWYPLEGMHTQDKEEYWRISGDRTGANCKQGEMGPDNCQSWQQYPLDTYVGWRGPFILWKNLNKLPHVYFSWASDGYSLL